MSRYDEVFKKALDNVEHPLSEITRRNTYRARSPGVKPTTGIKLILPKTSSMAQKIQKVLDGDDPKKLKQMNNLVIGREDDGKEISLEFKTSASREKFRKMMNEGVELDETVRTAFKGGGSTDKFQQNLKKFGFDKDYRKMMQNFIKRAKPGDGFYVTMSDKMIDFQIHPVADMMMGAKIKKLGDKDDLGEFGTRQLIAIKEDVQLDEGSEIVFSFDNPMKAGAFATRIKRDKLASDVDRYVSGRKEMVQIIMHPNDYERNDIEKLAKQYKGELREDINESILDKMDKMMDKVDRKMDRLARRYANWRDSLPRNKAKIDREHKERMEKIRKNFDKMVDELDRAYAHVDEDVQLDETMTARDPQKMVKGLSRKAKQEVADQLNKMNLGGYGDYKATVINVHKFRPKDLMAAMKKVMRLDELRKIPDAFERTRKIKNVFRDSDIKRLSKSVGNEAYDGGFRGDKEDLPGSVKDMVRNIHAYSDNDLIVILLADIPHASGQARMALQGRGHKVNSPARRKSDIKLRKS
jgi:hypothetical protein